MNTKIINLGCRLNAYESEVIRDILEKNNINNTVVVNTCAVTNLAVKKSKQIIKKVKKERPNDKILVTGCASQIEKQKFIEMKEVDRVIDNKRKTNENSYKYNSFSFESEIKNKLKHFPHIISKLKNKTRALLQIQQGCDHRCTFCIIPFGRGESVSLPIGEIVERANQTENILFDHNVLYSIALFVHSSSLIAAIPADKADLLTLNGGLIWYIASIISLEEYPQPNLKPAKP